MTYSTKFLSALNKERFRNFSVYAFITFFLLEPLSCLCFPNLKTTLCFFSKQVSSSTMGSPAQRVWLHTGNQFRAFATEKRCMASMPYNKDFFRVMTHKIPLGVVFPFEKVDEVEQHIYQLLCHLNVYTFMEYNFLLSHLYSRCCKQILFRHLTGTDWFIPIGIKSVGLTNSCKSTQFVHNPDTKSAYKNINNITFAKKSDKLCISLYLIKLIERTFLLGSKLDGSIRNQT